MKKTFSILIILLAWSQLIIACDICGCGISSLPGGILPRLNQQILGISYSYTNFKHREVSESISANGSRVRQDFQNRADLIVRLNPYRRSQLVIQVPYIVNHRVEDLGKSTIQGIGDLSIQYHHHLIDPLKWIDKDYNLILLGGVGLNMPTGKYQQRDMHRQLIPNGFQVGSGSWAMSTHLNSIISNDKHGLHIELQAQINSTNEIQYKRGNYYRSAINYFKNFTMRKGAIVCSLGLQYEYFSQDLDFQTPKTNTGGQFLQAQQRVDFISNNMNVGVFVAVPIWDASPAIQPYRVLSTGVQALFFL